MYRNRSRINPKIFIFLILTLAIAYGVFHFLTSPKFEQNPPKIEIADEIYWNLISPLKVKISDDTGVKSIKVSLNDGKI